MHTRTYITDKGANFQHRRPLFTSRHAVHARSILPVFMSSLIRFFRTTKHTRGHERRSTNLNMRVVRPGYKKKISSISIQTILILFMLVYALWTVTKETSPIIWVVFYKLTALWEPTHTKRSVSWQFSVTDGVTSYGRGCRKDAVDQCLEFGIRAL